MKRYWRRNESVGSRQYAIRKVGRNPLYFVSCCLLLTAYCLLVACSQSTKHAHIDKYTCPMHPTVVQDKPGTCPVCGMDLISKGKAGDEVRITDELNYLLKPVNATVISSIKTVTPTLKSIEIKTKANGIITYDTRALVTISSRFNGRVEKLFVRFNFQPIQKGQKILEIYSPDLLTAQRDLLYLLKSDKENSSLIDGAKEKLKLLGVSDGQINQLISTGKESNSFSVYSPAEGYVINSSENPNNPKELGLREGMYVAAGQAIFNVANPKNVWAEFDLFTRDAGSVKVNDRIQIKIEETAEELDAKINIVLPFYGEGQSFTKVRAYLSNSNGKFRIGQLVSASFGKPPKELLWIPLAAQLELGAKKIVFVKNKGTFRPREILTGSQSDKWIEVLKGINVNDSLAYNAQFMIDSESFIKIKD